MADLARLQAEHPEWNLVDAIDAPGGGIWAMGRDGGVFSLEGAPFLGSYPQLDPTARQGERHFVRIEADNTGGYTLISNLAGQTYRFAAPQAAPLPDPTAPPPGAPPPGDTEAQSARAIMQSTFARFGLQFSPTDVDNLFNSFIKGGEAQFGLDLQETAQYKKRFPVIARLKERAAKGETIVGGIPDPATILQYEETAKQIMGAAGLPPGFYDSPDDFAGFMEKNVSVAELQNRVEMAKVAAFQSPPEVRSELQRLGLDAGDLTAYFLDPTKADSLIQQKTLKQAQIGGAAIRAGFGLLTREESARLAEQGVSAEQAQQGFGELQAGQELYAALPGEQAAQITREQQLGAAFGGQQPAQEAIRRRAEQRKAQFGGGGGFAGGAQGVAGLGQ